MEKPIIQSVILGLGFRARCGKDTAAAEICKQRSIHGFEATQTRVFPQEFYDIRIYSFAGELKREVMQSALAIGGMERHWNPNMEFYRADGQFVKLPEWVTYDPDPDMTDPLCPLGKQRTLLQWWGTEFRRAVDRDYWVNRLAERLADEKPEIALITDMRFPNEMAFVQKYGEAIRVDRPDLPPLDGAAGVHASERALSTVPNAEWDFILENNTDLEDFRRRAVQMFDYIMSEHPLQRP